MSNTTQTSLTQFSGQASVMILAPIDRVYDYLANFTKHSEWNKNIYKVWQITSGPIQVGARFKAMEGAPPVALGKQLKAMIQVMAGMLAGANPLSEAEITTLDPNRRIAWVGVFPKTAGEFNRAEWEIELRAQGNATEVIQRFRYLPRTPAARKMLAALGDADGITQAVSTNLNQLKQRLEQHQLQFAIQPTHSSESG